MTDVARAHVFHGRGQLTNEEFTRGFGQCFVPFDVRGQIPGIAQFHYDVNISGHKPSREREVKSVLKSRRDSVWMWILTSRPNENPSFRQCVCVSMFSAIWSRAVNCPWQWWTNSLSPHILSQNISSCPAIVNKMRTNERAKRMKWIRQPYFVRGAQSNSCQCR